MTQGAGALSAAALAVLAALSLPAAAAAQNAAYTLSIPAQNAPEAMIELGLQANISILGAQTCRGVTAALTGRFTLSQALTRLSAGHCAFQIVDARTVRLGVLPPSPPPPPPRSSPARAAAPRRLERREPPPMSEIVVTATKRDLSLRAAAAAVSVASGEALRGSNTVDSAGAAAQIAGVVITNLGPGRDKILLRGMSDGAFTGHTRSTVGVYLDDAPITYNAPDPSLRLVDIDRIEVMRGPQGALYGAGLLSGVFRIVTNKPDPTRAAGRISLSYGDTQSGAGSQAIDAVINLPLSDHAAVRAVAYRAVDGGYLDDVNLRLSDVDRTTRDGGRLAFAAQTGAWDLDAYAAVQHLATNDTQYVTMSTHLQRANRVREAHKNDFAQAAVTVRRAFDGFRLQSATGLVQHRYSSTFDASAALSRFDQKDADLGVYREAATVDMLVQDAFLTSRGGGPFDWLIGVYGAQTRERSPSNVRASIRGAPPVQVYSEVRRDRTTEAALYGDAAYRFGEHWTASAGARVFQTWLRTRSVVQQLPPLLGRQNDQSKRFDGVSPKLSLQYDLPREQSVYVLASQGYRAGGFNTSGRVPLAAARAGFRPDRLQNVEVGARLHPASGLDLTTSLFYARWQDIQTDQFLGSGLSYTTNVGDGRNLGLEADARWRASERLDLSLNALLTRSRIVDVNPAFAARVGKGLPGIPKLSAGGQATWTAPLTDAAALIFGAQMRYVGASRLTFEPASTSRMSSYVSGKIWAEYRTPRWGLAAFISNPTNAESDTFAYGNPFSFGQVRQVTPQRPRTVMMVLSAGF